MAESDLRPSSPPAPSGLPGHCLKRVTLTRPTFCHSCSDFIWGLLGFQCEVCNFMCHEKCLKTLQWPCSSMAPSVVRVPVAHCLSPAGNKRRFCSVCRKPTTEGSTAALRCEVCELHVHADCAPFSCADCRRTHLDVFQEQRQDTALQHHWREGNLPPAARCQVCRRTCSSTDVLAGVRCEWCGVTCHSACYLTLPTGCALAGLRRMLLQPSCVRLQSRNFSKKHCYRITEGPPPLLLADDSDSVDNTPSVIIKDGQQGAAESGKHFLKVFDGDDALKRGFFRLVLRASKREDLVAAALRAFHLPGQPEDFLLQEVAECGSEVWLLRARRRDTEVVRVYLDWASGSSASFVSVGISNSSTVASILEEVVLQLQQDKEASTFSLVEVNSSSKQVQRVTLSPQEKILEKLQEIRKVSLRQMNQTRLYVQQREVQQQEVQVGLLVVGLPPLLATEQYVQLLQQHLDMKNHLVTVSHIYSSQGAVALQVSCFSEAERLFMLARETVVDERSLTSLIIPHIQVQQLAPDVCPLLVFVNPRSGGLKGRDLLHSFRKLLNPHQVFDISNEGPLAGLHTFQQVVQFRVLVCGGDGTVGWVLAILEAVRHKMACREPPIAILPLGTGNDLARVLRWGPGYSSEEPLQLLHSVEEADEVLMDRWTILLDHQDLSVENQSEGGGDQFLEPPKIVQMNNYFGLGIDAELSLDFHQAREDQPDKFSSRFHNKSVYVKVGLQKLSCGRSLDHLLQLQVDNQDVPLPHLQGLIFLNIPSWGSGADLWGSEVEGRFGKPRMDDGLLEVVGVTGVVHMGQIQSGMRSGIRIAQGNYIRLTLRSPVPVQVDGEPWVQLPGHIIISAAGPKVRMLRKSKQKQRKSSPRDVGRSESPAPADSCR